MNWYISVLKKYAVFSGRARRQEYWTFILVNLVIRAVLELLIRIDVISLIYSLLVLVPYLAVMVRRYHDTGNSAWFLLLPLVSAICAVIAGSVTYAIITGRMPDGVPSVPVIVVFFLLFALVPGIVALVFLVQDSQVGENKYGPNPKEEPEETQGASPDSNA